MRRWLCVFLLALLPLQFSWAAVAGYCAHESQPQARHLGHHSHEHAKASVDGGAKGGATAAHDGNDGGGFVTASDHTDCSQCHGLGIGAPVPMPVAPVLVEIGEPVPSAAGGRLLRIATPLDRPRWHPLA